MALGNSANRLWTDKFRCSSAVRPFNSPDRPPNSVVRQRSGIRVGPKWNQALARSRLACEGPESAFFAVFPRRTGESALGLTKPGVPPRIDRRCFQEIGMPMTFPGWASDEMIEDLRKAWFAAAAETHRRDL